MPKPKPLFSKTHHSYLDEQGKRWLSTAKPGSPLRHGCKWVKDKSFDFEAFAGTKEEGPFVIQSVSVDNITPEKALQISRWYADVAKWLKTRE